MHVCLFSAGKISIKHVTVFPSEYISKGAVDIKFYQMLVITQVIHI